MASVVSIEAAYAGDPDTLFDQALRFSDLTRSMAGLAQYDGLPAGKAQEGGTYRVDVTFWGLLKVRGHVLHVERLDLPARFLKSRERDPVIRRWDHLLTIQPEGDRVIWTDRIVVDAGWRTWLTARFAAFVYTRQHLKRRALEISRRIGRSEA